MNLKIDNVQKYYENLILEKKDENSIVIRNNVIIKNLAFEEREKENSEVTLNKVQTFFRDGLSIPNIKIKKVKNGKERYNGRGSGGVGDFFKNDLFEFYDITTLDNSVEDILWIKVKKRLKQKTNCNERQENLDISMSNGRNQSIPWSIIDNDGIVKTDKSVVLLKWKSDFEQLFGVDPNVRPPDYDNRTRENQPDVTEVRINEQKE
ncbi:unnamed protein product [Mytilus coruscus]|uniref:Uncharacterized protein n=1 Tax=Mytilus coruscus TaxID=42192 RepID=A0A6J8C4J9_MYTCO|nr:unnamed protein product [Mytilus coruscus]